METLFDPNLGQSIHLEIPFNQILEITSEEKGWGMLLKVKQNLEDKSKVHKFFLVKGWVKYLAKEPMGFHKIDWKPLIDLVKAAQFL